MKKESIYNYSTEIEVEQERKRLIYNTKSRKLLDFTGLEFSNLSEDEEKILFANGFLVEQSIDEAEQSRYYEINTIYQTKILSLTIIPTADCNFKCVYCYQTSKEKYINADTVERIIRFLDKNVKYFSSVSITWFGGEPLLCKREVLQIMQKAKEICRKYKRPLTGYMTTNGYELDVDFFEKALNNGLRYYQITIDGEPEDHNFQRPHCKNNDSYEKIMENLLCISKEITNKRFEIGIRVNVSSKNLEKMPKFIERISIMFANDKRFVLIWQWVRDWGGDKIKTETLVPNVVCKELMKLTMEKNMNCYEMLSCNSGTDMCEASYKNGYVFNYTGKVYKCAMKTFDNPEDDINCIGVLNRYGEIEVDIQKEAKWILPTTKDSCYKCVFFPICMGNACPYTAVYRNKKSCIVFKDLIPSQMEAMYHKGNYIKL